MRSEAAPEVVLSWGTAAIGIAALAHGCYRQGMKTLTMKVPDGLLGWLENEAKRARQPSRGQTGDWSGQRVIHAGVSAN